MKKILSVLAVLTLLVSLLGALPVSAAGSASVWVGETTVIIGDTVTVTLAYDGGGEGIGSLDAKFTYDANVFEYLSCTGATANGGAGMVKISYYSPDIQPASTLSIALKFKALTPGNGKFSLTTEGMYSDEGTLLENHVKSVDVAASNPTLSGNADLKSLVPSKGTLSPKFSPSVTEYKISVANSVTSLSLSATPDHSDAKTSISGKNALQVGKNTRVVTVTAPNGTTKKYTVVITRAAAPSTTSGTNPTTTGTTLPQPPDDALEVSVGGKTMTILDTQAATDLPDGFKWSNLTVNLVEVPAAVNDKTGMTLLYLTSEEKTEDGFYIYDAEADTFTKFRLLQVTGGGWLLYDLPDGAAPAKAVRGTLTYEGGTVSAYTYEDGALADFYILWAAPVGGEAGWYTYDKKEGTLQRYHTAPVGGGITAPTTTKPGKTEAKDKVDVAATGGFFETYRQPLLIGIIAVTGVAVLVIVVLLIASMGGRKKGKH